MNEKSCFIVFTVTDEASNKEMRLCYPPTQTSVDTKGSELSPSLHQLLFCNFRQKLNCLSGPVRLRAHDLHVCLPVKLSCRSWRRLASYISPFVSTL
jgi:hypothetical protein